MHQDLDKMFQFVEMWYLQLLQQLFYRSLHSIVFVIDHKFSRMLHEVLLSISEFKKKKNKSSIEVPRVHTHRNWIL